jgi:Predicted RNA polymerase sigma factor containing a TPR repeat domain
MAHHEDAAERVRERVDAVYRTDSRRVFATLIRLLGDFDLAEEALHEAFRAALEQWPQDGVPANPRAWLVSAGRFKAIDSLRRRARFDALEDFPERVEAIACNDAAWDDEGVEDDRLRLIFTCCHPALPPAAQVALTLREVCGLTTEEIARAFLTPAPTLAQRIVRAKAKIRDARIPYRVPELADLPDRLDSVLRVVYLVFNEGYSASSGASLTRPDLSGEAIRLGRLLVELLPEPEAVGLLALMLLQESRRAARSSPAGHGATPAVACWRLHRDEKHIMPTQQHILDSHTYSTYARGTDLLVGTYNYLDLTPLGRQEDWEEPPGRSDSPFLAWVRHHCAQPVRGI